jgi:hypothetical protein
MKAHESQPSGSTGLSAGIEDELSQFYAGKRNLNIGL